MQDFNNAYVQKFTNPQLYICRNSMILKTEYFFFKIRRRIITYNYDNSCYNLIPAVTYSDWR